MTSESMTNLEIEDVLSSIRRLVSEDVTEKTDAAPDTDGRFVLTPALRVSEDEEAGQAKPVAQPQTEISGEASPEAPDRDLDEDRGSDAADLGTSESENQILTWPAEPGSDDSPADAQQQAPDTPPAASEPTELTLESRIAELEEAVGRTREEWEPDGSEPDAGQMPKWHLYQVAENPESEPADTSESEDETSKLESSPVFFRASAPKSDPYVLADAERDPADGDATAQENQPATTVPQPAKTPDAGEHPGAEDEYLDELALRTMVADIVREELRGRTGERITRNMRRMVRREIQRALALKDVD